MSVRKPNFLVIGAARSGTTALCKFLEQHPEVFVSSPKEPHFLAFANQELSFAGPGDDVLMNRRAITQYDSYTKLFEEANGAVALGEGSVSTLYYPETAIPNIKEFCPDAKCIVVLRNPVERAYSGFLYMIARGFENEKSFEEALESEDSRIDSNWHHIWHYKRQGMYAKQIKSFQDALGTNQLKIILSEDLKGEATQSTMPELYEFIGVDRSFQAKTDAEINRSGKPKNKILHHAMSLLGRNLAIKDMLKAAVPSSIRERIRSSNLSRPEMNGATRESLTTLFQQEISELSQLINRDLGHWLN